MLLPLILRVTPFGWKSDNAFYFQSFTLTVDSTNEKIRSSWIRLALKFLLLWDLVMMLNDQKEEIFRNVFTLLLIQILCLSCSWISIFRKCSLSQFFLTYLQLRYTRRYISINYILLSSSIFFSSKIHLLNWSMKSTIEAAVYSNIVNLLLVVKINDFIMLSFFRMISICQRWWFNTFL